MVDATGVPSAMASSTDVPSPSSRELMTKQSASATSRAGSSRCPIRWTRSREPELARSRSSAAALGPSPATTQWSVREVGRRAPPPPGAASRDPCAGRARPRWPRRPCPGRGRAARGCRAGSVWRSSARSTPEWTTVIRSRGIPSATSTSATACEIAMTRAARPRSPRRRRWKSTRRVATSGRPVSRAPTPPSVTACASWAWTSAGERRSSATSAGQHPGVEARPPGHGAHADAVAREPGGELAVPRRSPPPARRRPAAPARGRAARPAAGRLATRVRRRRGRRGASRLPRHRAPAGCAARRG